MELTHVSSIVQGSQVLYYQNVILSSKQSKAKMYNQKNLTQQIHHNQQYGYVLVALVNNEVVY